MNIKAFSAIIGIGFFPALTIAADFPGDFKSALELYNKKEYAQAQEAFLKLAEAAPTPKSKSECLAYAASSLGRQGQYDRALELTTNPAERRFLTEQRSAATAVREAHRPLR